MREIGEHDWRELFERAERARLDAQGHRAASRLAVGLAREWSDGATRGNGASPAAPPPENGRPPGSERVALDPPQRPDAHPGP